VTTGPQKLLVTPNRNHLINSWSLVLTRVDVAQVAAAHANAAASVCCWMILHWCCLQPVADVAMLPAMLMMQRRWCCR
jgi:hypothetical protein